MTVIDVVIMGNEILWKVMVEKEALLERGDEMTDEEGIRLGELEMTIIEEDGCTAEAEAAELFEGLGIEKNTMTVPYQPSPVATKCACSSRRPYWAPGRPASRRTYECPRHRIDSMAGRLP